MSDPLTPEERATIEAIEAEMIANGRAFVCGICQNLVDSRLTVIHAEWHDEEAQR